MLNTGAFIIEAGLCGRYCSVYMHKCMYIHIFVCLFETSVGFTFSGFGFRVLHPRRNVPNLDTDVEQRSQSPSEKALNPPHQASLKKKPSLDKIRLSY